MPIIHQTPDLQKAPLLVVLPGMNSGSYLFGMSGIVEALGGLVRLHVVETPGSKQGKDFVPVPMPFSAKAYAADVLRMLDKTYPGEVFFVMGHSLGSFAAQELVRMVEAHTPARILGLILVSSGPGQPYTSYDITRFGSATGKTFWQLMKMLENDPERGYSLIFGPNWTAANASVYQNFLRQRNLHASSPAALMAQITAGGTFTSAGWAHVIKARTLAVHGGSDALISAASGKALAGKIGHAHYLEFYHVGHFPMLEHPGFYDAIKRFLAGHVVGEEVEAPQPSLVRRLLTRYFTLHG